MARQLRPGALLAWPAKKARTPAALVDAGRDGQGSEYSAAVIPLTTQHYPMLQRNLAYTAVPRGKRLVVLVGQRKALAIAVKGSRARRRWSKLREWLIGGDAPSEKQAES
jgi:hypothetical protein